MKNSKTSLKKRGKPRKPKPSKLREDRFIAEFLIDLDATRAAIAAGCPVKTASQQGYQLLQKPRVADQILKKQAKQLEKAELTKERVLEELRRLAFSDLTAFYLPDGTFKPLPLLTADQRACLAGMETIVKNAKAGDGVVDTVLKIKLWDKIHALEQLAKHFGLLVEKIEHSGDISFRWLEPGEEAPA